MTAPGVPGPARLAAGLAYAALAAAATAAWPPLFFFTGRAVPARSRRAAALAASADLAALAATAGCALLAFQTADPEGRAAALLLPLLAGLAFAGVLANGVAAVEAGTGGGGDGGGARSEAGAAAAATLVTRARRLGGLRPGSAALAAAAASTAASLRKRRREASFSGGVALAGETAPGAPPLPPPQSPPPAASNPTLPPPSPRLPGVPASASLPPESFCDPGAAGFRVRGPSYLVDGEKIAPPTTRARLVAVELVRVATPVPHIARFLPSISASPAPFTFVWQVSVPGRGGALSLVAAWALDYCPLARAEAGVRAALGAVGPAAGVPPAGVAADDDDDPPPPASPATGEGEGGRPWWRRRTGGDAASAADEETAAAAAGAAAAAAAAAGVQRSAVSATGQGGVLSPAAASSLGHRRAATAVDGAALAAAAACQTPPPPAAAGDPAPPPPWWAPHTAAAAPFLDPFDLALSRFILGVSGRDGDAAADASPAAAARAAAFKIIPRLTSGGGWVLQRAVGQNTPCLLATKIDTTYHRGPTWFEVDVDVGSSRTAAHVVGLVQGAVRGLVIDVAVLVQGNGGDELPEGLVGVVRLDRVDVGAVPAWAPPA